MGFAQDSGYTPASIETIISAIRENINEQFGTDYTAENFIGTNFYKYFYALVQRLQENEVKTAEIFTILQQYFAITNERIQRPVATNPGLIENFAAAGYLASVKPMIEADAGKLNICVDVTDNHARGRIQISNYANLVSGTDDAIAVNGVTFTAQAGAATPGDPTFQAATSNAVTAQSLADQINAHTGTMDDVEAIVFGDYVYLRAKEVGTAGNAITYSYTDNDSNIGAILDGATFEGGEDLEDDDVDYDVTRLAIATIIKDSSAAGVVTQGPEVEPIVLTNGQSFDFKFHQPNRIDIGLRLTTTLSENNQVVISSPEDVKAVLLANIAARYGLGKNFEPQRYFSQSDAPWTGQVLLEWTDDVTDGVIDMSPVWNDDIYDADFDDLLVYDLSRTILVEE